MLKAIDTQSGRHVISIDPVWETGAGPLRDLCCKNAIACPECRQPVGLRAGNVRIWHFAHRADSNCPLKSESAAILRAREMLYKLLRTKFGDRVSLEDVIHGAPNSERADCVVYKDAGKIAYCIVEKQLRNRFGYMNVRQKAHTAVQWIVLPQLLQKNPDDPEQFLLSATARDLAAKDGINEMYGGSCIIGSLCCADAERGQFLLARGLECVHKPNVFEPHTYIEVSPEKVILSPKLGQLMVASEVPRYKEWQRAFEIAQAVRREAEARAKEERKRRKAEQKKQLKEAKKQRDRIVAALQARHSINQPDNTNLHESRGKKELTCLHCKSKTRNWVAFIYNAAYPHGTCLCRECHAAGMNFPYEDLSQRL